MKTARRVEWPTLTLILVTYAAWTLAGWLLFPVAPVAAIVAMTLLTALHSSLTHEVCHGHPTRSRLLNEALVTVNPGLIWPYRRFREVHMRHHCDESITDPFEDPESYYRAAWWYAGLPKAARVVLGWSNTLVGRLILGPVLGAIALGLSDFPAILRGDRKVALAWALHLAGLLPVAWAVVWLFSMPLWLYVVTVCWGAAAIISLRTFAEHQWHETPDGRTIIVERSPLAFLFLFNNLHIVHHTHPTAPWYRLPALYRDNRDAWQARNHGYVFDNYWQLFRSYALVAKEPVVHPVWHHSRDTL